MLKKILLRLGLCATVGTVAMKTALAAEQPALSPDLLADAGGGYSDVNADASAGLAAGLTLKKDFRLQADAAYSRLDAADQYGAALHLAKRAGASLLGLSAMDASIEGNGLTRAGAEGKLWLDRFSFNPSVGYQNFLSQDTWYGDLRTAYYPADHIRAALDASVFYKYLGVGLSGEYQFSGSGLSLLADAGLLNQGINGYASLGVRWAFGEAGKTPLIRRDITDNSVEALTGGMGAALHNQRAVPGIPPAAPVVPVCFIAGTLVLMSGGVKKRIEDVLPGEKVLGVDGAVNTVAKLERHPLGGQLLYSFNGSEHFVTANHPLLTEDGWKAIDPELAKVDLPSLAIGHLNAGDTLVLADGAMQLESIIGACRDSMTQVYNLAVSGNETYFVGCGDNFIAAHS